MDLNSSTFIIDGVKFKTYKQLFLCFHFISECWNVYISYYCRVQCYEFWLNLEYEREKKKIMNRMQLKNNNFLFFQIHLTITKIYIWERPTRFTLYFLYLFQLYNPLHVLNKQVHHEEVTSVQAAYNICHACIWYLDPNTLWLDSQTTVLLFILLNLLPPPCMYLYIMKGAKY
jgi:hypothetical protein